MPSLSTSTQQRIEQFFQLGLQQGCPKDQLLNFCQAGIILQPRQLAASAAARSCDQPKCNRWAVSFIVNVVFRRPRISLAEQASRPPASLLCGETAPLNQAKSAGRTARFEKPVKKR